MLVPVLTQALGTWTKSDPSDEEFESARLPSETIVVRPPGDLVGEGAENVRAGALRENSTPEIAITPSPTLTPEDRSDRGAKRRVRTNGHLYAVNNGISC